MRKFLPLLAVLAICSCKDTKFEDPAPVGSRNQVWPDVPVYRGLSYVEEGDATADGSFRVSRMTMRGGNKLQDVLHFYRTILPKHQWELKSDKGTPPEAVTLVYEKGKEELTLVAEKESSFQILVQIRITAK